MKFSAKFKLCFLSSLPPGTCARNVRFTYIIHNKLVGEGKLEEQVVREIAQRWVYCSCHPVALPPAPYPWQRVSFSTLLLFIVNRDERGLWCESFGMETQPPPWIPSCLCCCLLGGKRNRREAWENYKYSLCSARVGLEQEYGRRQSSISSLCSTQQRKLSRGQSHLNSLHLNYWALSGDTTTSKPV